MPPAPEHRSRLCVSHVDSHCLMQNRVMHWLRPKHRSRWMRTFSLNTVFWEAERSGDKASLAAGSQRDVPLTMVTIHLALHFNNQIWQVRCMINICEWHRELNHVTDSCVQDWCESEVQSNSPFSRPALQVWTDNRSQPPPTMSFVTAFSKHGTDTDSSWPEEFTQSLPWALATTLRKYFPSNLTPLSFLKAKQGTSFLTQDVTIPSTSSHPFPSPSHPLSGENFQQPWDLKDTWSFG